MWYLALYIRGRSAALCLLRWRSQRQSLLRGCLIMTRLPAGRHLLSFAHLPVRAKVGLLLPAEPAANILHAVRWRLHSLPAQYSVYFVAWNFCRERLPSGRVGASVLPVDVVLEHGAPPDSPLYGNAVSSHLPDSSLDWHARREPRSNIEGSTLGGKDLKSK